jgi:hypothetical protein
MFYYLVVKIERFKGCIELPRSMVDFEELDKILKDRGLDLDRITDPKGKPIEPKIKPLLYVLNVKGYETTASCEGHPLMKSE